MDVTFLILTKSCNRTTEHTEETLSYQKEKLVLNLFSVYSKGDC